MRQFKGVRRTQRLKKPRDHLGERKNCPSVKSNAFQLIGLRRVDVGGQALKKKRVDTPKQEPARNDSKNPQYRDRGLGGTQYGTAALPSECELHQNIQKNRCRTTVAEPIGETLAELPLTGGAAR
jgi:hypothetical protein